LRLFCHPNTSDENGLMIQRSYIAG